MLELSDLLEELSNSDNKLNENNNKKYLIKSKNDNFALFNNVDMYGNDCVEFECLNNKFDSIFAYIDHDDDKDDELLAIKWTGYKKYADLEDGYEYASAIIELCDMLSLAMAEGIIKTDFIKRKV